MVGLRGGRIEDGQAEPLLRIVREATSDAYRID